MSASKDKTKFTKQTILGIDPGTSVTGYCLMQSADKNCTVITSGVIRLHKIDNHYSRLHSIYQRLNQLISEYRPDELAIEAPFFGKNVQSMLKLGRAQGVAITVALSRGLPVHEYSPRKIKLSITGNGNASKKQVYRMLQQSLSLIQEPQTLDESDAMATALCHHFEMGKPGYGLESTLTTTLGRSSRKKGNWKKFLEDNPDRLAG